jgi:hypothetical protein
MGAKQPGGSKWPLPDCLLFGCFAAKRTLTFGTLLGSA